MIINKSNQEQQYRIKQDLLTLFNNKSLKDKKEDYYDLINSILIDFSDGMIDELRIEECDLLLTCWACPEQYDVYKNGYRIGYLRLRHGIFRAEVPDCMGATVYLAQTIGDGRFDNNRERIFYLRKAIESIENYYKNLQYSR